MASLAAVSLVLDGGAGGLWEEAGEARCSQEEQGADVGFWVEACCLLTSMLSFTPPLFALQQVLREGGGAGAWRPAR